MSRAAITGNGCLLAARLAGVAALLACADARPPAADGTAADEPAAAVTFAPELDVDLDAMIHTDGGVYVRDLTVGTGATAVDGSTVVVDYRAWLPDGTLYEQRPDDQGFGSGEMMIGEITPNGLNDALAGMRAGGVRRIVLPPERGYGLVGRPANVPAGSTLVYEVRLRAVR